MVTKILIQPSFKQGFARNASESANPHLWRGKVGHHVPGLGVQGNTLYDVSGYGNRGTLKNGPTWVIGKHGYALDFDGIDDYVSLGVSNYITSYPFSLSAWVNVGSTSRAWRGIISKGHYLTNKSGFWFDATSGSSSNAGKIQMSIASSFGNTDYYSSGSLTAGVWQNVTVVVNSGTVDFYIDGLLDVSRGNSQSFTASTNHNLFIGANNDGSNGGNQSMLGGIDNIRIYHRALTPAEIMQLYIDPFADLWLRDDVFGFVAAAGGSIPIMDHHYRMLRN